ncbi:hypothetical protein SAMN05192559_10462 [Halobacillus karajensis]|uniref:group-specific protein n=1 Tax=Halobacillus karajensis TaxID=195088 RepID=UPI0008A80570|nr:group-specific protein [Halobacillus karajensis]SEH77756.1 hypothetical protein SAMN05192559_10462 [Halobacillus karajensis]
MIQVQIDEAEVREIYLKKIEEKLEEVDSELVFWDRKELMRRTCLSWNTIQKEFFFDADFPKYKVGTKWLFPADKTKDFLVKWLERKSVAS